MPRCRMPSASQQDKLLDLLEEMRWIATGCARTSNARSRTKAAWEKIAMKLNSNERGCIKSWQQWSKYWKDKKSAVKRKYSQICLARKQTQTSPEAEDNVLSPIEGRIVALMGGEQFAIGDRDEVLETKKPCHVYVQSVDEERDTSNSCDDLPEDPQGSSDREDVKTRLPTPPGPATNPQEDEHASGSERTRESPAGPRCPRSVRVRRRALRRAPQGQRRTQLASVTELTERFIAIEEQRVETERMLALNQREMVSVLREMTQAWSRQSQTLHDLLSQRNNNV